MRITVNGLIITQTIVRDCDKYLTVLTEEYGKISVYAAHVRNIKKGSLPYTLPFQYCRLIINKKTDTFTLCDGDVLHSFLKLQDDLDKFALSQYILELSNELTVEGENCRNMLRLVLNTLYILLKGTKPLPQIKATFELRAMALSGFMPDISGCKYCAKEKSEVMYFDIMNGTITCKDCHRVHSSGERQQNEDVGTATIISQLSPDVLACIRFVLFVQDKKIFSINIPTEITDDFAKVAQKYTLNHLERGFCSLDFYREVVGMK